MESFSKSFIGSDSVEVRIYTQGDFVSLSRHCTRISTLCHIDDIGKVIEILQEAHKELAVVCEFTCEEARFRVTEEKGEYVLYLLCEDNWNPYHHPIDPWLLSLITKALLEKK